MSDKPTYTSQSTVRSFWQEYRIYDERLEFDTVFGRMTIPFEHVEGCEVLDSDVKALLRGDLRLKGFRPALKIDWANFLEHVVLDTSEGGVRRILFTPDDSQEFKTTLDEALSRYRRSRSTNSG